MLTKIEDTGYSSLGLPTEKNDLKYNLHLVKGWITSREQGTNKQTHYVDSQNLESLEVDSIFAKINASITGQYHQFELRNVISQRIQYREKLEDKNQLEEINKEFPVYRKVKVQEGFLQIFEQHLGVVESVDGDTYNVRYWELTISAKLSEDINEVPAEGSDVQFVWNHKGESVVTKVFKNLLES